MKFCPAIALAAEDAQKHQGGMAGGEIDDGHGPGVGRGVTAEQENGEVGDDQQNAGPDAGAHGLPEVAHGQRGCGGAVLEIQAQQDNEAQHGQ